MYWFKTRKILIALCLLSSAAGRAQAQGLPVIRVDPALGPICAGPLGPGPCAQVQQYILTHPTPGQPLGAPPQLGGQFGPQPGNVQLNGTPQQVAINCAQRSGTNVTEFATCAGGNVILPQREHALLDCAASTRTTQTFAECAAPQLGIKLTQDQRALANCAMQSSGDASEFATCMGTGLVGSHLTSDQRAVLTCAENADGDASKFASCSATQIVGPRLSKEQRVAIQCAAESNGDYTGFATCAGTKLLNLNLNPEQQIAVQCVVQTGGQPYAAAGCMATRLTGRELEKCAQHGFGGDNGCFGNNNDLVGRNGWVARNFRQIAGGPNSVINNPGQLAGGPNSVINNPGQLAGGPNSVINNPGQLAGGPNSVINNPGQLAGGPNSVLNNPGQLVPPPINLGTVGGHRVCVPWC